jgi:prepilin signal peptidase PulO-like enzyme (type II secretory pathway)
MRKKTMASKLPFGVYLAPAGVLMLFAGPRIIELVLPTIG